MPQQLWFEFTSEDSTQTENILQGLNPVTGPSAGSAPGVPPGLDCLLVLVRPVDLLRDQGRRRTDVADNIDKG